MADAVTNLKDMLPRKLDDAFVKLRNLWDKIGVSEDERATYLGDLAVILDDLLKDAVDSTATRLSDMEEEVRQAESDIVSMNVRLGNGPVGSGEGGPAPDAPAVERRDAAQARLSELREHFDARVEHLERMRSELCDLWRALGDPAEPAFASLDEDLSTARVAEFEGRLAALRIEASERRDQCVEMLTAIQGLMVTLKVEAESDLDRKVLTSLSESAAPSSPSILSDEATATCVGIGRDAVAALAARQAELNALVTARRDKLTVLGEEISALYDRLEISDAEQAAFAASVDGLGPDTIRAGEAELGRLKALLCERLSELVGAKRAEIAAFFEEMATPEERRAEMKDLLSVPTEELTEEVLTRTEEACAALAQQAAQMRPLLRLIEKRNDLVRSRAAHADRLRDPEYQALLTGRSKMARIALKELEATEKGIKRDLPRITESLRKRLAAWEREHGDFVYGDKRYLEIIDEEQRSWDEAKQQEKREKLEKKAQEKAQRNMPPPLRRATSSFRRPTHADRENLDPSRR